MSDKQHEAGSDKAGGAGADHGAEIEAFDGAEVEISVGIVTTTRVQQLVGVTGLLIVLTGIAIGFGSFIQAGHLNNALDQNELIVLAPACVSITLLGALLANRYRTPPTPTNRSQQLVGVTGLLIVLTGITIGFGSFIQAGHLNNALDQNELIVLAPACVSITLLGALLANRYRTPPTPTNRSQQLVGVTGLLIVLTGITIGFGSFIQAGHLNNALDQNELIVLAPACVSITLLGALLANRYRTPPTPTNRSQQLVGVTGLLIVLTGITIGFGSFIQAGHLNNALDQNELIVLAPACVSITLLGALLANRYRTPPTPTNRSQQLVGVTGLLIVLTGITIGFGSFIQAGHLNNALDQNELIVLAPACVSITLLGALLANRYRTPVWIAAVEIRPSPILSDAISTKSRVPAPSPVAATVEPPITDRSASPSFAATESTRLNVASDVVQNDRGFTVTLVDAGKVHLWEPTLLRSVKFENGTELIAVSSVGSVVIFVGEASVLKSLQGLSWDRDALVRGHTERIDEAIAKYDLDNPSPSLEEASSAEQAEREIRDGRLSTDGLFVTLELEGSRTHYVIDRDQLPTVLAPLVESPGGGVVVELKVPDRQQISVNIAAEHAVEAEKAIAYLTSLTRKKEATSQTHKVTPQASPDSIVDARPSAPIAIDRAPSLGQAVSSAKERPAVSSGDVAGAALGGVVTLIKIGLVAAVIGLLVYRSSDGEKLKCSFVDAAQSFGQGQHISLADKLICALPAL